MRDDTAPSFDIIEEHGSFLLIRAGSRFAVVERRAGRIYPMMPGEREGEPMTAEGYGDGNDGGGLSPRTRGAAALSRTQRTGRSSRPRPSIDQPVARAWIAEAHASQVCRMSSRVWASDT